MEQLAGGLTLLVTGERGEGCIRDKLKQRMGYQLTEGLKKHKWAGWTAREATHDGPDVFNNWRLMPWQHKHAERLATRRILDGAARAHFLKQEK